MNELFLEIQQDIRRERAEKLWRSFGRMAVWASIAVILCTIGYVIWQDYARGENAKQTALLIKGTDRMSIEDYKGAVPIFDSLAADKGSAYYGIAMLRKAEAQRLGGNKEGAAKTYAELAATRSEFAEIAKVKTIAADKLAEIDATSPFYYSLNEYNAWALLSAGKKDEAAAIFLMLASDDKAPRSLGLRAQEMLQHIAPEKFAAARAARAAKDKK